MVINYSYTSKILQQLYCDRCTIEEVIKNTNRITGITKIVYRKKYTKIPCYISYRKGYPTENNLQGSSDQIIVLFLDVSYQVPAGSLIHVWKGARPEVEELYSFSSAPMLYQNHQEIVLESTSPVA